MCLGFFFFFQAEDGIRDGRVTGVQTCALPISLRGERVHLFAPEPAVRFLGGRSAGPTAAGENPLPGAAVTYWLQQKPTGDVALTFLDSAGTVIRTYSGKADSSARVDSATYAPADSAVPAHAGTNRFVWNLRAPDAKKAKDIVVDEGMIEIGRAHV